MNFEIQQFPARLKLRVGIKVVYEQRHARYISKMSKGFFMFAKSTLWKLLRAAPVKE